MNLWFLCLMLLVLLFQKKKSHILKFILWILASPADAATFNPNFNPVALNPKWYLHLLANGGGTFFIYGKPTFINGPWNLLRIPRDSITLGVGIFDNFKLNNFAKLWNGFKLIYLFIKSFAENYFRCWQSCLMIMLELC